MVSSIQDNLRECVVCKDVLETRDYDDRMILHTVSYQGWVLIAQKNWLSV